LKVLLQPDLQARTAVSKSLTEAPKNEYAFLFGGASAVIRPATDTAKLDHDQRSLARPQQFVSHYTRPIVRSFSFQAPWTHWQFGIRELIRKLHFQTAEIFLATAAAGRALATGYNWR
jgi:hypothetical protein